MTGGIAVARQLHEARNPWQRFRGLMLRSRLDPGVGLRIEPCRSIHMMFMRFPIDAVFYDREGRVTKVARNVRPWVGFAFGGKGAHGVIELLAGSAPKLEPGDRIAL